VASYCWWAASLDTPQEVFQTFGAPLGKYLFAIPDGEVGPRRHWISRVHYQVLAAHPELEVVQRPAPDENGVERQFPRNAADAWWFKVKDGVKQVRFGDPGWRLGYARDAVNSYFVFRVMKEKGVLPPHIRFQVSIPMVNSVLPPRIFPNVSDLEKIRPGYEEATRAEIATIIDKIPAEELAIQWDCSTEVQDAYGGIPGFPLAGAIERNLAEVPRNYGCRRASWGLNVARRFLARLKPPVINVLRSARGTFRPIVALQHHGSNWG
jgi:hypothetical protein